MRCQRELNITWSYPALCVIDYCVTVEFVFILILKLSVIYDITELIFYKLTVTIKLNKEVHYGFLKIWDLISIIIYLTHCPYAKKLCYLLLTNTFPHTLSFLLWSNRRLRTTFVISFKSSTFKQNNLPILSG